MITSEDIYQLYCWSYYLIINSTPSIKESEVWLVWNTPCVDKLLKKEKKRKGKEKDGSKFRQHSLKIRRCFSWFAVVVGVVGDLVGSISVRVHKLTLTIWMRRNLKKAVYWCIMMKIEWKLRWGFNVVLIIVNHVGDGDGDVLGMEDGSCDGSSIDNVVGAHHYWWWKTVAVSRIVAMMITTIMKNWDDSGEEEILSSIRVCGRGG